jgi:hypothetical protein
LTECYARYPPAPNRLGHGPSGSGGIQLNDRVLLRYRAKVSSERLKTLDGLDENMHVWPAIGSKNEICGALLFLQWEDGVHSCNIRDITNLHAGVPNT